VRILITGSRDWTDRTSIARRIMRVINENCPMLVDEKGNPDQRDTSDVVIVHGACRGVDLLAAEWAEGSTPPIKTEPHPALWKVNGVYDPGAGYARNAEMVRAGADVCLAFIQLCRSPKCRREDVHGSHGASHCSDLAEEVGIPTIRIRTYGA
jgi:YspA, cpYpsA-related SLOG family